jgi:hypothetical protein
MGRARCLGTSILTQFHAIFRCPMLNSVPHRVCRHLSPDRDLCIGPFTVHHDPVWSASTAETITIGHSGCGTTREHRMVGRIPIRPGADVRGLIPRASRLSLHRVTLPSPRMVMVVISVESGLIADEDTSTAERIAGSGPGPTNGLYPLIRRAKSEENRIPFLGRRAIVR